MSKITPYILMAEDDDFLMNFYKDKLLSSGFKVVLVNDGQSVIDKLHEGPLPDLILLDLIMPKKTGFQVLSEVKADPNFKDIPVIILSNLGQDSDVKECMDLGAVDFILKPKGNLEEIVVKIKKHLGL